MNRFLGCLLMSAVATTVFAQGGTNSPFSQFGLGEISQQGASLNKGMNGVGYALHEGNMVNTLNPASSAYVDSLTFLFDMGLTASVTNFQENGARKNARTGNFDYAVGQFRLWKNVGAAFGVVPMTDVGYQFSSSSFLQTANSTMTTTYVGDGGLNKLFLGVGVKLFRNLAVGARGAYLWGSFDRGVTLTSSQAMNTLYKNYKADVSNYALDFGLQYDLPLSRRESLTLGLTYGLGHKLKSDAECYIINYNSTTSKRDTAKMVVDNAFELPHTFGVGLAYRQANKLTVGLDGEMQRWGNVKFPAESGGQYQLRNGLLKNSYRFALGAEWLPRYNGRSLFQRIRYRLGVGYATPYYKIGSSDGPKQYSATIGFGIPIQNQINARSYVNISAQYVHQGVEGMLKENTFRLNLAITFNERWFAKWKVE